jgi:Tfp pilus assembly PilM family ATPase
LGLDIAHSGVKAVRLKKAKERIVLAAADILDPFDLAGGTRSQLPKPLASYYAALCGSLPDAHLRVFSHALQDHETLADVVRENMSIGSDYRVAGRVLSETRGKRPGTVLGIAVPEHVIDQYLALFATGAPAPNSLELSGLSAFSAFLFNYGTQTVNQTICLVDTGWRYTYLGFFHQNQLQVISRLDVGGEALCRQVQKSLGVDEEMARTILAGGSIDVSGPVRMALSPLIKQLPIYKEYVERQNKSMLAGIYISGGEARSACVQKAITDVLGLAPAVWNPFLKLEVPEHALPDDLAGQEPRFAAAVGAALTGLEAL